MNVLSDYPDILKEALIPMIIAIFALGFPLLIQTVSRIDDKYSSTKLIATFRKDWICKWFLWILIATIASYVIWLFQIPPLVNWGWIIDNSALIFITISTIALIIIVFFIVYLTYIYYVPELLLKRLIKKYDKEENENKQRLYLQAISKLLNYSIQTIDEPLADKLWEFYFSKIKNLRQNKENQEIVYPKEYYDTFLEANEILCEQNKKAISRFNNNSIFDLFLDGYQQTVISQDTYYFLWKLILQSLHYNRTDFVLSYWRKAHQLFNFFMKDITPNVNYQDNQIVVTNKEEVEKQKKIRNDFLEFHYALGGLLMYKQKYNVIKELMYFTQSQPPEYVLVPETMSQVIERYMQINWKNYFDSFYYERKYLFPDIHGADACDAVRMWLKRYLAILFIRQYTLHEYYDVNSNMPTMPQIPKSLLELNHWINELRSLEDFVKDYLSKREILKELGFEQFCNPNWFSENNKIPPSVLIENFKKELEDSFNKIKTKQTIDKDKKTEFQEATIKRLKPVFEKYSNIFTNKQIGDDYESYYINGQYHILEKAAFSNNQNVSYVNSDSIVAESVVMQFQYYATNFFIFIMPQKYFLTGKDVFMAIGRLNIKSENFVIVSVGLYLDYFESLKINGLKRENEKWYYNDIEIIEMDNCRNYLVNQSLFILKKEDLPNMILKEIDTQFVSKYNLQKIDTTFNIYAGLIDLNETKNEEIREKIGQQNNQTDLSQKVLACVDINVEIQYKKAKCIQLKAFSQFDDRGKANKIEDIKDIWIVND